MSLSEASNRELVTRLVSAGPEDAAWMEFVSRFHGWIRSITLRAYLAEVGRSRGLDAVPPGEAVDDLTQEVFVRLIDGERRALAQFQGRNERSIYTYLCTIATNLVKDHFKKLRAQRRPPVATSLNEPLQAGGRPADGSTLGDILGDSLSDPEKTARSAELRARIWEAVDQASTQTTSKRDRLIFRLYFVEGLTLEEVASIRSVGLSASGVEKRVRRIRTTLKNLLGQQKELGG